MGFSLRRLAAVALPLAASVAASNNQTYDYIVVGGGPSGIITAERLAEANKTVLLLERGHGPTAATGSNYTLSWNSSLTPIDVPGLSSAVSGIEDLWEDYICPDTPAYAACVLGGGVSVNYMVFVHPPARDFDQWPAGWQWDDVAPAAQRLYSRNRGSTLPSQDGAYYDGGLYNTLSTFFRQIGWTAVDMIEQPDAKHQVYSHPAWNIKDALRAGPVRTYLPRALQHDRFHYRLRAKVTRLLRDGPRVTGVEVEDVDTGRVETLAVRAGGRVVLASGALSTPRILFHSGIGPADQIAVANASGIAVPPRDQWIDLPVGRNLKDHPIFYIVVNTTAAAAANTTDAYAMPDTASMLNGSDVANIDLYERRNAGILTQGRHRLIFFSSAKGPDGITRYFQGSCAASGDNTVTMTTYMTHGLTSTGVLQLDADGSTYFAQSPYLQTQADNETAAAFLQDMVDQITAPSTGFTLSTYLNTTAILGSLTSGIHYCGTAKMGLDNTTSVVDTNTKVHGMDNLVSHQSPCVCVCLLTNHTVHRGRQHPSRSAHGKQPGHHHGCCRGCRGENPCMLKKG